MFKSSVKFIASGGIKSASCVSTGLTTAIIGFPAISKTPLVGILKYVVFEYLPRSLFIALKLAKVDADILMVISGEYSIDTVPLNDRLLVVSVIEN